MPVLGQFRTEHSLARSSQPYLFASLMIGMTAQGMAFTAPIAGLPQIARAFGPGGELIAALTIGLTAAGLMIGALFSGVVLERLGTRRCMLWMLVLYGLAGTDGLLLHDPWSLLISRFLLGFATACLVTTCVWGIAQSYSDQRRPTILGWASSFSNISSITGTLVGGWLADAADWHLAFALYPLLAVIAFGIATIGVNQLTPSSDVAAARSMKAFKALIPAYLIAILLFMLLFMGSVQLSFILNEAGYKSSLIRSLVLSLVTVWGAIAASLYGRAVGRIGSKPTYGIALLALIVALLLIGLDTQLSIAIAAIAASAFGIFAGFIVPHIYDDVSERAPPADRSRAIGFLTAAAFLGGFLNGPVFKFLARFWPLHGQFLAAAAVAIALCIHPMWLSYRSKPDSLGR